MPGVIAAGWAAGTTLAAPGLRLMLRRRAARGKEVQARLPEREGIDATPRPPGRLIWLHAASVGETASALPVIDALLAGGAAVLVTTGTVTSAELLAQRCPPARYPRLLHRFVPLDVPRWAARFVDHWRPDAAAFLESELWPNLIAACTRRRVPMMLLNARMSARSHAGWARWPGIARQVTGAFTAVWAQSAADVDRLRALGAADAACHGNLKFAAAPLPVDDAVLHRLRTALGDRPRWLAASTHPGEEALAAAAHAELAAAHPGLLTVIAPRHPGRGAALAAELGGVTRSASPDPPAGGIWVADSLGEMGLLYRLCPIVVMGKSLLPPGGGQNPLEPARLGCAVAAGPWMQNQADAAAALTRAGGLQTIDAAGIASWVAAMLADPARCRRMGAAASAAAAADAGLPAQAAAALLRMAE